MLRTDTHELTEITHLFETVSVKDSCLTWSFLDKTCEHWNSCWFSSAIMTKHGKYLVTVHLYVEAFNSLKACIISFFKIFNTKVISKLFLSLANQWWSLIVCLPNIGHFKLIIIFTAAQTFITCLLFSVLLTTTTLVGSWEQAEDRWLSSTEFNWKYVIEVKSHCSEEKQRPEHHPDSSIKWVVLVDNLSRRKVYSNSSTFILSKDHRNLS